MPLTEEQKAARAEKRRLTSAREEEARVHRAEAKRREWRENDMYLTREQAAAGEPCRGCGLPIVDDLGDWPGTMYLTPEEGVEYDKAELHFRALHPDCNSHLWSMQGSRVTHCGLCCPPLPFPDSVLDNLARVMASFPQRREEELDVWALVLTCGHQVERTMHYTNREWTTSTVPCAECDSTRGVVTSERVTDAEARAEEARKKHQAAVDRARDEVRKAEVAAEAARRKLADLEG